MKQGSAYYKPQINRQNQGIAGETIAKPTQHVGCAAFQTKPN